MDPWASLGGLMPAIASKELLRSHNERQGRKVAPQPHLGNAMDKLSTVLPKTNAQAKQKEPKAPKINKQAMQRHIGSLVNGFAPLNPMANQGELQKTAPQPLSQPMGTSVAQPLPQMAQRTQMNPIAAQGAPQPQEQANTEGQSDADLQPQNLTGPDGKPLDANGIMQMALEAARSGYKSSASTDPDDPNSAEFHRRAGMAHALNGIQQANEIDKNPEPTLGESRTDVNKSHNKLGLLAVASILEALDPKHEAGSTAWDAGNQNLEFQANDKYQKALSDYQQKRAQATQGANNENSLSEMENSHAALLDATKAKQDEIGRLTAKERSTTLQQLATLKQKEEQGKATESTKRELGRLAQKEKDLKGYDDFLKAASSKRVPSLIYRFHLTHHLAELDPKSLAGLNLGTPDALQAFIEGNVRAYDQKWDEKEKLDRQKVANTGLNAQANQLRAQTGKQNVNDLQPLRKAQAALANARAANLPQELKIKYGELGVKVQDLYNRIDKTGIDANHKSVQELQKARKDAADALNNHVKNLQKTIDAGSYDTSTPEQKNAAKAAQKDLDAAHKLQSGSRDDINAAIADAEKKFQTRTHPDIPLTGPIGKK